MAIGKWIGGFLGFIAGGPLGGLAGLVLGALFDVGLDQVNEPDRNGQPWNTGGSTSNFYQHNASANQQQRQQGERNSFLFSLLVLSAYIIRADGKVMHSEMETLRSFLRRNFGEVAVEQGDSIIRNIFDQQKQMGAMAFEGIIRDSCFQIAAHMNSAQRLQLLSFLVELAKADGHIDPSEVNALRYLAQWLGFDARILDSMFNLDKHDTQSAYKVLGISPNATNDEVKAAYRKMALQHHPDRVATLGEDIRLAAEKKFKEINDAKERIYKERGM
mgnify:FL=1